jgi:glycosyltransferase involved in cell wall biosynthesis
MSKLVTIGIPVYKRLEYLPNVLKIVGTQDYPNIELLVSDNGMNGEAVSEIVNRCYSRPSRFRQNPSTVGMSIHFNQIIHEASGEYFVLLADDDEISSNYVSDLVDLLERHPQASVAMAVQETVDEAGTLVRRSSERVPEILSGPDFIRAVWGTHEFGYESLSTFLARTANLTASGGFPDFWKGSGNDDALIVKLCLDNFITLSSRCVFRKRCYDTSYGYSQSAQDLARGINDFLKFVDTNPILRQFACDHPSQWRATKHLLVKMAWTTYYWRWADMYRQRLSPLQWVKAGFALPFMPDYYRAVTQTLAAASVSKVWGGFKKHLPRAYQVYRAAKTRRQ